MTPNHRNRTKNFFNFLLLGRPRKNIYVLTAMLRFSTLPVTYTFQAQYIPSFIFPLTCIPVWSCWWEKQYTIGNGQLDPHSEFSSKMNILCAEKNIMAYFYLELSEPRREPSRAATFSRADRAELMSRVDEPSRSNR
jgi:hypothetical protein